MNNNEAGQKLVNAAPSAPNGGCYGDPDFYAAYIELVRALGELIPNDRSHGALGLKGVGSMARARCKVIVDKSKSMETIMKAITTGR